MGKADFFQEREWNVRCQECWDKVKSGDIRRRWDNELVCPRCFEIRNPQDFVRGIPDNQSVPYSTADPTWIYEGNFAEQQNPRLMDAASPQWGAPSGAYVYNGLMGSITMG